MPISIIFVSSQNTDFLHLYLVYAISSVESGNKQTTISSEESREKRTPNSTRKDQGVNPIPTKDQYFRCCNIG
ncbi:hypothetical protein TVAG_305290 [Trichomonas vaginalis G3]|uniref:Uncharacterized protein n=1 Tax=Trichomonas vaginalis (strain ATCC PRA-98 / G3) TaxID=412133 RepID=A2ERA4_TRIV3|nr:hypothetical protein TVAGG3_1003760 [Trichomonas vaginalis G3]EAY04780.1 hypothetical protein TVAG_305290 [Trichomonas vaginalis G3]KAI5490981.1 hypothetical protein TVAGG3_1003760 [Trichomonas vaginalis G3]|eukprot:XP_001317003.1 hypothetical protein [Trichomonas vaginalis G3]